MSAKFIIKNQYLNNFTWDLCYNLPQEKIRELSLKYRRMFASQNKVKSFCEKASLDERLHLFNEIGLESGLTILPEKKKIGIALKDIWDKYENEKIAAAQRQQGGIGIYVTTSKETAFLLGFMGQTINNETYLKTLQYNKTSHHLRGWKKEFNSIRQLELQEITINALYCAETILNAGLTYDIGKSLFNLYDVEAKVLLHYYVRKAAYLTIEDIYSRFAGYITNARLLRANKKLYLNGFIQKHLDWEKKQYTISSDGVRKMTEFINESLNCNFK